MKPLVETLDETGLGGRRLDQEIAGRYKLVDALGQGGVGHVFSARDLQSNRLVALKLLRGETAQTLLRLKNEFRILSELQHRNIVVPYELFFHEDLLCYSMELVDGVTIVEYCRGHDTSVGSRDTYFQLIDALEAIHHQGIVHRDLKPDNILVTRGGRVVLLDFGVSKTRGRGGITQAAGWVGTPAYMAPEQFLDADPSPASDWYAFGAVLFECLTGRLAFPQLSVRTLVEAKQKGSIANEPFTIKHSEVGTLLHALLDPDPRKRPSGAGVREALRQPTVAVQPRAVRGVAAIGRTLERSTLTEQVERVVQTGRVGVVSVVGAQGTGKTRLVEAFRAQLRGDKTAFVAAARCSSAETLPLRVVDSLLDDLISEASYDPRVPIERCYPRHGAELCATFPCAAVLFGKPKSRPTGDTQALGLRALADLLARVSEHVTLVLIVDDLQNSDDDGFDALLRLVLDLAECRVLVVLAGSGAAARPIGALLQAGRKYLGAGAVTEIELGPMSDEELAAIAWEELWSWRGAPAVVESLVEKSFGNPGTCVWYARALLRSGAEPLSADEDMDRLVFRSAWDLLSESAKQVLAYVSLAEHALPRAVLVQLVAGGAEEADAAVRISSTTRSFAAIATKAPRTCGCGITTSRATSSSCSPPRICGRSTCSWPTCSPMRATRVRAGRRRTIASTARPRGRSRSSGSRSRSRSRSRPIGARASCSNRRSSWPTARDSGASRSRWPTRWAPRVACASRPSCRRVYAGTRPWMWGTGRGCGYRRSGTTGRWPRRGRCGRWWPTSWDATKSRRPRCCGSWRCGCASRRGHRGRGSRGGRRPPTGRGTSRCCGPRGLGCCTSIRSMQRL